MSARRALVTGAGGFVGANLCRRLLRDGHGVNAVVRPGTDVWRLTEIRRDITLHHLDLRDVTATQAVLDATGPDWVFHLAAHGAYSWQTDATAIFTTNTVATARLVDLACARGFEAFVQAGSTSEYGFRDHRPREAEAADPHGPYAISKAAATQYARGVALDRGAHLVTLRLSTAYGPWEEPNRLMPALAVFGLHRRLPPLTDPQTVRDFIFVDDVCDAFVLAACRTELPRGSVLNIGSGTATSLAELVDIARAEFALDDRPRWSTMPARAWDTRLCVADCTLSRRRLGWRPRCGLAEGFHALAEWLVRDAETRGRYVRASGPVVTPPWPPTPSWRPSTSGS